MRILKSNKSSIFLMELMIVVLFTIITITICVNIFLNGQKLSQKSYILTNAVIQAENAAQLLNYDGGEVDSLVEYYRAEKTADSIIAYFDNEFQICTGDKIRVYQMKISQNIKKDTLIYSNIVFSELEADNIIYALNVSAYKQEADLYE